MPITGVDNITPVIDVSVKVRYNKMVHQELSQSVSTPLMTFREHVAQGLIYYPGRIALVCPLPGEKDTNSGSYCVSSAEKDYS